MAISRLARFEKYVVKGRGCWTWAGARLRAGYGSFKWASYERELAHRAAWRLYVGSIPEGVDVLHRCDNPPCVRVDHLFLGDQATNSRDMVAKHRHYSLTKPDKVLRGATHPMTKLSPNDVATIRQELAKGTTKVALARRFGVSHTLIGKVSRHHWSDQ